MKKSTQRALDRAKRGEPLTDREQAAVERFTSHTGAHAPRGASRPRVREAPAAPPKSDASSSPGPSSSYAKYRERWQDRIQVRDDQRWKRSSIPQGETRLLHVWASVVHAREIPPEACTLSLVRTNGEPYEILIPGEIACLTPEGPFPERALLAVAMQKRQQPTVQESFYGRITAPGIEGGIVKLGEGTLDLPPDPGRLQARTPWGDQAAVSTTGAPWAPPLPSPPPGYPYGGAGYGPPPSYPSAAAPAWAEALLRTVNALEAKVTGRAAAPAPQTDPVLADAYRLAQEAQRAGQDNLAKLVTTLIERVTAPHPPAPALPPAAATADPFATFERNFDFMDRMMGRLEKRYELARSEPDDKGLGVTKVGDTTILTSNGKIDPVGTAFVNLHDEVKGAVKKIVEKRVSGAHPPKGTPATSNLAQMKH